MLTFFRSFMNSRLGVVFALGFLALIALAFAAGDISNSRQFGSVTGGDRVATVGSRKISTAELGEAASSAVDQLRQEDPRLSLQTFVKGGGLAGTLEQLLDRAAIAEFGAAHGIVAGDRLVDSELAKIGAFKGVDGKFSEQAFRAVLAQRRLTESAVRRDIADGLIARQLLVPAAFGARMPTEVVSRYAALLSERRSGAIAMLPAAAFVGKGEPSAADIAAYYTAHRDNYVRPERRTIRYAVFDDSALKNVPAPTEAEIAARYKADAARFAPTEYRKVTQLILPSETLARAAMAEAEAGKALAAVAAARGLDTATLGPVTRAQLASQTNEAIATAAFAAAQGKLTGPVRGNFGWSILRVDAIDKRAGKTLDQARAEIAAELATQKKRAALSDFTARVEEEFDNGGSLGDVAKELGTTVQETAPLTADGKVYGTPQPAPADLARVIQTAFSMEREGQPQLAEVEPGKKFVIFEVGRITASAAAPIAEIRPQVMADLMIQRGSAQAKAAAQKLQAAAAKGTDLAAALGTLGVAGLPPVERIDIDREEYARRTEGGVAPPLALLFSMAKGTTKVLAAPGNRGWFVVSLAQIVPGDAARIKPLIEPAGRQLSQVTSREYADQLRKAMRDAAGVKTNQVAIDAVARQLTGN